MVATSVQPEPLQQGNLLSQLSLTEAAWFHLQVETQKRAESILSERKTPM